MRLLQPKKSVKLPSIVSAKCMHAHVMIDVVNIICFFMASGTVVHGTVLLAC